MGKQQQIGRCKPKSKPPQHVIRISHKVLQDAKDENLPCAGWLKIGEYVLVDVEDNMLVMPRLAKSIKSLHKAKDARESHNRYLGYTPEEVRGMVANVISEFINRKKLEDGII